MSWRRFIVAASAGAVFLSTAGISPHGWAQSADSAEQVPEALKRETGAIEQTVRASGRARDFSVDDGAPVTYADVLKDPDNLDLNYRFARAQIQSGNVRGAAATLERILLIAAELVSVRMLYAVVLFRLDSLGQAEKEFRTVLAEDIPAATRAEAESFLKRIDQAKKLTRFTATVSIGGHFDTNRDSAPRGKKRLVIDTPIAVNGAVNDAGYIAVTSLRVKHDLGFQAGHELFGGVTYFQDEQVQQDSQDIQSISVEGGGTYRSAYMGIDVIPKLAFSHLRLSRETFFKEISFDLRLERRISPSLKVFAAGRVADQQYSPIRENQAARDRNGRQIGGMAGFDYALSPTMRISADYTYFDKNASLRAFGYDRDQIRLNHTWLLGGGQFLLNNFTYQRDRYERPDTATSGSTRHDDSFRYRVGYGAPLGFFFSFIGMDGVLPQLDDVGFTASLEGSRTVSNVANFDRKNLKGGCPR